MDAIKLKDLLAMCLQEYKKGHGDYTVFVTDDEEANGYHALWFTGQAVTEFSASDRQYMEDNNCDLVVLKDKDKAIYLG